MTGMTGITKMTGPKAVREKNYYFCVVDATSARRRCVDVRKIIIYFFSFSSQTETCHSCHFGRSDPRKGLLVVLQPKRCQIIPPHTTQKASIFVTFQRPVILIISLFRIQNGICLKGFSSPDDDARRKQFFETPERVHFCGWGGRITGMTGMTRMTSLKLARK